MTDRIDYSKRPDPKDPTQPAPNISTRNQKSGDAQKPGDHLDRDRDPPADDGDRKTSLTKDG